MNLTHAMLETLGRAIVTGRYDDRPFPIEAELAKAHGVSRSVTREAVKMLTAKGLVRARARQGTTVQPVRNWNMFDDDVLRWLLHRRFSVGLLRDLTQLRAGIEPEAAALAASVRSEAAMALLRAELNAMAAAERGVGDLIEADIAFHVAILEATANPFYAQLRGTITAALRTSIGYGGKLRGRVSHLAAHVAVADAIEARDPAGARMKMQHLIATMLDSIEDRAPARPEMVGATGIEPVTPPV